MKKARLDFFAACLVSLLAAGCAGRPVQPLHLADIKYRPDNIYSPSRVLDPKIRRVAVLPITPVSVTESFLSGAELMQQYLAPELEKTKRFDLVVVSPEDLQLWTGQRSWRADEPFPPDFFSRMHNACNCDAVFFTQLTRYQPYKPVAVGWKMALIGNEDAKIIWAADEVLDSGDATVANAAEAYSGQHVHTDGPLDDPGAILGSPSRFGQYSLSALLETLPAR